MINDPVKLKQLEEARTAYHNLATGTSARVVVDQNGERVEFSAANRAGLYAYIKRLESELGIMACAPRPIGPAQFVF